MMPTAENEHAAVARRSDSAGIDRREAEYWDAQAERLSEAELDAIPSDSDAFDARAMSMLGDLRGRRILDVGCGTGGWAVLLAQRGAEVWAVDISPESIAVTRRRAERHGVLDRVHASVMSVTALDFADGTFDAVHGQDIIHHIPRAEAFGREVARVLAPHGRAVFVENCANNRVLMFARDHLCGRMGIPKWSSEDEYPLTRRKLREFGSAFSTVDVEYPRFLCFFYIDAKLFGYRNRLASRICRSLDRAIYTFAPVLRQYSYRQAICFRGPPA